MAEHVWKDMALKSVVTVHQNTPMTHAKMLSALLATALMEGHAQPQDLTTRVVVHLGIMEPGVRMIKMVSVIMTVV